MTAQDHLDGARQRLALSRQRLLDALGGIQGQASGEHPRHAGQRPTTGQTPAGAAAALALNSLPRMVLALCNGALAPVASRHPWRLVLGAAALGAILVVARPWRWAPQVLLAAGALRPWLQPMLVQATSRMAARGLAPAPMPGPQQR